MPDDIFEFIIDLILDIVLEGAINGAVSKKVPLFIRILLGTAVFTLYAVIVGLLLYVAIETDSVILTLLAAMVAIGCAWMVMRKYKEKRTEE